jgi:hypothetical protein
MSPIVAPDSRPVAPGQWATNGIGMFTGRLVADVDPAPFLAVTVQVMVLPSSSVATV